MNYKAFSSFRDFGDWITIRVAIAVVAIVTVAGPPQLLSQRVGRLEQTLAAARWTGEYTRVRSTLPGPHGLLFVETSEKQLIHVHEGMATVSSLRDGEGPEEVRGIRQVVPYRGDSAVIFGRARTRAVVVTDKGVPVRTKVLTAFNTDSTWLFRFVGTGPAGQLAFISPRRAPGQRDSADVLLLDPTMEHSRTIAALWYPPPSGMYETTDAPDEPATHDRDQVLLLPSGYLVVYHSATIELEIQRLDGADNRHVALPGRDRALTRTERRALEKGAAEVAARRDSAMASMPPETRDLVRARLAAAGVGKIPDRVSAYNSDGLLALTETVIAIERKQLIPTEAPWYDWVDVRAGTSGSFQLPQSVAIVGAGQDSVVLTRQDDDDLVSVAVVPVRGFQTPLHPVDGGRP